MKIRKFPLWIVGILAFLSFSVFSSVVALIVDWWWFSEVGYTEVFITSFVAQVLLGLAVSATAFLFLIANLLIATSSKTPWFVVLSEDILGRQLSLGGHIAKKIGIVISFVISVLLGLAASSQWQDVLKFFSSTPFGAADPVFGKDIAFYVFSLPVITFGLSLFKTIVFISLIGCGMIYVLRGSLNLRSLLGKFSGFNLRKIGQPISSDAEAFDIREVESLDGTRGSQKETLPGLPAGQAGARIHIALLLALFFVTMGITTYLSLFKILTGQSGQVYGAVFTDVYVMVPLIWLSVLVIIIASLAALYWGKSGKTKFLFGSLILYVLVGFASSSIPSVFQKLIVTPNELVKETPYIKRNIAATRVAYGLDKVEEREIGGDKPLTAKDITNNNLTIKNVRLWDRAQLLSTFSQLQEIRTYYEFASIDNDRYTIDGEIRQIMLSPRELSSESLPNRNWINERLTFTHGYGIAAGPVNQVTAEGLPVLFVKDLPPKSEVKELTITRPEIYYGELANDYVFVKTKSKEFDYPRGEENVYSTYKGKGGVEINSLIKRIVYAIHFRSLNLLLSDDITKKSRVLYYRNIKERALKIAPFLTFDRDPYSVIADGKIYWIADAYTTSDRYPYSQPLSFNGARLNYIRNSVKVVIDAYDGSVTFYLADTEDPIIRTYVKIFPKMFRPLSEMPKGLASHLRYPEDIFTLQAAIYATYHMDDPQIFYNKEDQWEIPAIVVEGEYNTTGKIPAMTPRHMIMKLSGEKKEEYILMLPFTPRAKDNLSAWMVARNDGANYGKISVYRFPKQKLIFGPKQVIGRINQDVEISRQISLWDQGGSQVIQGSLLVIPIEESLIYVRPLYLKADTGKIPELKRVIVAYENRVAMEETLEAGLARIFGGFDPSTSLRAGASSVQTRLPDGQVIPTQSTNLPTGQAGLPTGKASMEELVSQASQAYEAALRAQRDGDWSRYGVEIKRLGEMLSKLRK